MSERILTFDEVVSLMQALGLSAEMIAIDGAPLAGKSTLAERLVAEFGFGLMSIDDFVRTEDEWSGARPSYPYPYFRNDDFANALRALRDEGQCLLPIRLGDGVCQFRAAPCRPRQAARDRGQ